MKLFWKQWLTMVSFIIAAFMIVGNIMIHTSFQMALEREETAGVEEAKMFQYAFLASFENLPDDYQAVDTAVEQIVTSIQQSLDMDSNTIVIYDSQKESIYESGAHKSGLLTADFGESSGMWQIAKHEGHYEMETLSMLDSHFGNYYVEMDKDISYVYEERERMYDTYKISLVVLCIVFSLLACLISFCYTRPVIRRLEDEARKQEEFTASFSHELKTPLTSIIGYADSLRSMQLSQEETAMSANYIFQEGRRLERLSWKMMELFYLDKQEIHFQQIPVKLLAQRLEEETKQALSKKKIRFSMQIDDGMINGDFDLLLSLLVNLTDNARKACAENGEITWMGACTENGYELQIKDNGIGIPEEEVDKITEAFYMVDKSRARKEGGAGLGMALCRKIVSLHQAEWKIESRIGEGTQITVRFPDLQAGQH